MPRERAPSGRKRALVFVAALRARAPSVALVRAAQDGRQTGSVPLFSFLPFPFGIIYYSVLCFLKFFFLLRFCLSSVY